MSQYKLPDNLYEYQKEDASKMSQDGNWLNFSEMGTGKTPIALQVAEEGNYKSILIICPNSLRWEWKRQIEDWVEDDLCALCTSDSYTKLSPILHSFLNGQKYKILNYEAFRNPLNLEILQYLKFDLIIMDEIHKIRNPATIQVEGKLNRITREREGGIWKFMDQHPESKVIGMTGSPIMNYPIDLYTPLSIVRPEEYPRDKTSWKNFTYKYAYWTQGRFGSYMFGTRHAEELRRRVEPYVIRRTKQEVLPFLPNKYYRRTLLEMREDQRKVYNQMVNELKILLDTGEPLYSPSVLALLTRLRQINIDPKLVGKTTSSAKTDFLMDLVDSTDEKIVVFSCFEKYIYLLSTIFLKNTPHVVVTGETPANKRVENVKKFQNDPSIKLFLGTIQTGGEGITLTASSNCVLVDRWWNQPTNDQAADRLHRIGQKNAVQVILPIVKDSVDQIVDGILERKHEATQEYFGESQVRQNIMEELYRG